MTEIVPNSLINRRPNRRRLTDLTQLCQCVPDGRGSVSVGQSRMGHAQCLVNAIANDPFFLIH